MAIRLNLRQVLNPEQAALQSPGSCREQLLGSSAGATLPLWHACRTLPEKPGSLFPCFFFPGFFSLLGILYPESPELGPPLHKQSPIRPHSSSSFFVSNLHVGGSRSSFLLKEPSSLAPLPRFKVKTTIQQAESTIHPEHYSQTKSHDTSVPASRLLRIF